MNRSIRLERVYPHGIDHVWRAVTDSRALAAWLMENDFLPEVGREFTFKTKPRRGFDGTVHCKVLEIDPPRRLSFSWRGGPGPGKSPTLDTVLTITLTSDGARTTRFVLEHTGFTGLGAVLISFMLEPGWKKMLNGRLPRTLELLAQSQPSGPHTAPSA